MSVQVRSVSLDQVSSVCQLRSGVSSQVKLVSSGPVRLVRSYEVVSFRSTQARIGQFWSGRSSQVRGTSVGEANLGERGRGGVRRVVRMGN